MLWSACQPKGDRTQIMVVVDTNFQVPDELTEVWFQAYRDSDPEEGQEVPALLTDELGESLPLTLALKLKDGADEGPFTVVVSGYRVPRAAEDQAPLVRRKARVSFQRGRVMSLDMHLVRSCADEEYLACEALGQTCTEKGCEKPEDAVLQPWDPTRPSGLDDAGVATHPDGGTDDPRDDAGSTATPSDGGSHAGNDAGNPDPTDAGSVDPVDSGGQEDGDYAVELALGQEFSCARMRLGDVYCWGKNDVGQLGDNDATHQNCNAVDCSASPVQVQLPAAAAQLAAGTIRSCVVHEADANLGGNLTCWGGDSAPSRVEDSAGLEVNDVESVSVGDEHACYVTRAKQAFCWGENYYGQVGNGVSGNLSTIEHPIRVTTADARLAALQAEPEAIRCGVDHTCLRAGGEVMCWGDSTWGQAGTVPPLEAQPAAFQLDIPAPVSEHVAGVNHSCALAGGAVFCWGDNLYYQLGHDQDQACQLSICNPQPRPLAQALSQVVDVSAGGNFTCALTQPDGIVYCWGDNESSQLGDAATQAESMLPVEVLRGARAVVAGHSHACAILAASHEVRCWGSNKFGELGPSATVGQPSATPVRVELSP